MDQNRILSQLNQKYVSKRGMLSRLPLGVDPEALWQELLNQRRASCTALPLYNFKGTPYWYVTTNKIIAASEKVVEALLDSDSEPDLYTDPPPVETLEEVFYTGYVEGLQITMQAAMDFLAADRTPEDIEEQLVFNNRFAGGYASRNLYSRIDAALLRELAAILTEGMDGGGQEYRADDTTDFMSVSGEVFAFPSARIVPERVNEMCEFMAHPQTHPLIKAAAAQAYMMILRPFPEGNDRLGRILSNMILLRSGYSFFGEVSLSALIARKSYAYYEAAANTLREENGGDLTYFLEYFFELLSRAIDERRLRKQALEDQERQKEAEMARTALSPAISSPFPLMTPDGGPPLKQMCVLTGADEESARPSMPAETVIEMKGFQTVSFSAMKARESESRRHDMGAVSAILSQHAANPASTIGQVSGLLLRKIEIGRTLFTLTDIASELNVPTASLSSTISSLKKSGIIRPVSGENDMKYYQFVEDLTADEEPVTEDGFHPDVRRLIDRMTHSKSMRDKRVGEIALSCLEKGIITADEYDRQGYGVRWETDMLFATQMGLVRKINSRSYEILKELKPKPSLLSKSQRRFISEVYELFGTVSFSASMVVATLKYSDTNVSANLHMFTLLNILDCRRETVNHYQFLVTPEESPEYFITAA